MVFSGPLSLSEKMMEAQINAEKCFFHTDLPMNRAIPTPPHTLVSTKFQFEIIVSNQFTGRKEVLIYTSHLTVLRLYEYFV